MPGKLATGGTADEKRCFNLNEIKALDEIPASIWEKLTAKFSSRGLKRGEMPSKGTSIYVGRMPHLDQVHEDAKKILQAFDGQEIPQMTAPAV